MLETELAQCGNLSIRPGFFGGIAQKMRDTVLPFQWKILCDEVEDAPRSHSIENFRIAAGEKEGAFYGWTFQDTDVAKWLEAAAYALADRPDETLMRRADRVIDLIGRAQCPDGYLNTYYSIGRLDRRFTNLRDDHELYTAGHMMEAAVAYYQATGKRKLLDIMLGMARCIDREIGPEPGKKHGYPGHPEIELALMRMYRLTGEEFLYKLAKYFIDARGTRPLYYDWEQETYRTHRPHDIARMDEAAYVQARLPVRALHALEGHCVRAMYLLCGMIDVAAQSADPTLLKACHDLYDNAVSRRMYVTGGLGSTVHGEGFTLDYDLPNDTAYAETCASVALIFAAQRLLYLDPDARYADHIERALVNCCLASIGIDGKSFFYVNPLEVDPEKSANTTERAHALPVRPRWFGCACCPPNVARLMLSLGRYILTVRGDVLYLNQFIASEGEACIAGQDVRLSIATDYPLSGDVRVRPGKGEYAIALRVPDWCARACVFVDGAAQSAAVERGYALLRRAWTGGEEILWRMDMAPRRVYANAHVAEDAGKVALQRGPIVYCAEQADNGPGLHRLALPADAPIREVFRPDLLGGVVCLAARGLKMEAPPSAPLYRYDRRGRCRPLDITWIPYYAWANRGAGEMRVWLDERPET